MALQRAGSGTRRRALHERAAAEPHELTATRAAYLAGVLLAEAPAVSIESRTQRPLSPPLGLRTRMMKMAGEEWLVLSFPVTVSALAHGLTPSERVVVDAVLRGLSNADIARERGKSVHTIGNQIASVFKKLGVHSRLDLVRSVGGAAGTHRSETTDPETVPPDLAFRTRQVLAYRAMGHALKFIAYELGLSTSTVHRELERGMAALGLRSPIELARLDSDEIGIHAPGRVTSSHSAARTQPAPQTAQQHAAAVIKSKRQWRT